MPTASPGDTNSTHHVVLTHSTGTIGLILVNSTGGNDPRAGWRKDPIDPLGVKIYQGEAQYSDLSGWAEIVQQDWSGGRGQLNFEDDRTRFYDSSMINTSQSGKLIMGGMPVYTEGYREANQYWEYAFTSTGNSVSNYTRINTSLGGGIGQQFTTSSSMTNIADNRVILRYYGDGTAYLKFALQVSTSNQPAAVLNSVIANPVNDGRNQWYPGVWVEYVPTLSSTVASGTAYWLTILGSSGTTASNYWQILGGRENEGNYLTTSDSGSTWSDSSNANPFTAYYRLASSRADFKSHFAHWRGNTVMATQPLDGTVSKIYINGDHGLVTGSTPGVTLLPDTTKNWTANEHLGSLAVLVSGAGSEQDKPWSVITTNDSTHLTVDFDVAPAAQTEYAIVASDKWLELNSTGAPGGTPSGAGFAAGEQVIDMLSTHGFVYFALDTGLIVKMHYYNNAAVWTADFSDDVTPVAAKPAFMRVLTHGGDANIYWARADYPATLYKYDTVDGTSISGAVSTDLTAEISAREVGDTGERIQNAVVYGEGFPRLFIGKENSLFEVINDTPIEVPIAGIKNLRDNRNFKAMFQGDVYLWFNIHNSLLNYFDANVKSVGPDKDEGLPKERVGTPVAGVEYKGMVYLAIDGGKNNFSTIQCWNGSGWHQVYRAPKAGLRILSLYVEPIPGDNVDRLWFGCGSDVLWLPLDNNPFHLPGTGTGENNTYNFYPFAAGGYLITSWMHMNFKDVDKFWRSIKGSTYESSSGLGGVYCYWQVDDETTWTLLSTGAGIDSLADEIAFSSNYDETSKRIRLMLAFDNQEIDNSINLQSIKVDGAVRYKPRYIHTLTFRVKDKDIDLRGSPSTDSYEDNQATKLSRLRKMAESALPAAVTAVLDELNSTYCFVNPASVRVLQLVKRGDEQFYVCQLQLLEVLQV